MKLLILHTCANFKRNRTAFQKKLTTTNRRENHVFAKQKRDKAS